MNKDKIIFWVTTGLISLMMLFSAYNYFTNPEMQSAFVHLGFPDYFRVELGIAKVLGALVLIIPMVPKSIKNAAYFGFVLVFISAIVAHLSSGDPIGVAIAPIVFLVILIVSYLYSNKSVA